MNNQGNTTSNIPQDLIVQTLGQFSVRRGNVLISSNNNRANKLWDLFKYILTHRDKGSHPEAIQEHLWPDTMDAGQSLRTLVYRLRKVVDQNLDTDDSFITFAHGSYNINMAYKVWIDTSAFVELSTQAQLISQDDPDKAIELYHQALELYKGEYLPECLCDWVEQWRNHFRRIYLQSANDLLCLLLEKKAYTDISQTCVKIFQAEPFEEDIHLCYLKALLEMGKTKQAKDHYEYITAALYTELGVKPSTAMREMYRLIQLDSNNVDLDLTAIYNNLQERQEIDRTFFCDPDIFRYIFKLESRRLERTGHSSSLGLFTVTQANYRLPPPKILQQTLERLKDVALANLRKGDVISLWNEAQLILILTGANYQGAQIVMKRIEEKFYAQQHHDIVLRWRVQAIDGSARQKRISI